MRTFRLAVVLTLGVACSDQTGSNDTTSGESNDPNDGMGDDVGSGRNGAALFRSNCATCHGENGEGDLAPNPMEQYVSGRSQEQIVRIILNGNDDNMPAVTVTNEEAVLIAEHVLATYGTPEPVPPPEPCEPTWWYPDLDGDGYGTLYGAIEACDAPTGFIADNSDCNDADAEQQPGAEWYPDVDGDGYGDSAGLRVSCARPLGYVSTSDDCDDMESQRFPGNVWYIDGDGDGFGESDHPVDSCGDIHGASATQGDCNDDDLAIHPAAREVCDQIDNNCDLLTDDDDPDIIRQAYPDTCRFGADCKDVLASLPNATDGVYWIDPNGGSTLDAFEVECDMANGGWTRLAPEFASYSWRHAACGGGPEDDDCRPDPVPSGSEPHRLFDPSEVGTIAYLDANGVQIAADQLQALANLSTATDIDYQLWEYDGERDDYLARATYYDNHSTEYTEWCCLLSGVWGDIAAEAGFYVEDPGIIRSIDITSRTNWGMYLQFTDQKYYIR